LPFASRALILIITDLFARIHIVCLFVFLRPFHLFLLSPNCSLLYRSPKKYKMNGGAVVRSQNFFDESITNLPKNIHYSRSRYSLFVSRYLFQLSLGALINRTIDPFLKNFYYIIHHIHHNTWLQIYKYYFVKCSKRMNVFCMK